MNLQFSLCQSAEHLKCARVEKNKRWYFFLITAGEQIINQGPESEKERKKKACGDIQSISRLIHIQFCQDQMANEIQPHFPKGLSYDPPVFTVEIFPDISVYILYFLISFCCAHLTIVESKPSLYFIFEFLKITVKSHPHCSQVYHLHLNFH